MKHAIVFVLLALCLAPFYAIAEEESEADPVRGRLPDGRAFRTDPQGTQLVDYIAELELSVEELNRRVGGLEDEVKEKQALIERLQKGQSAEAGQGRLIERDLTSDLARKDAGGVSEETGGKSAEIGKGASASQLVCPPCHYPVELAKANEALDLLRTDLEVEQQKRAKETGELRNAVINLEGSLKAKDEELEGLRAKLTESETQVKSLEVSLRAAQEKASQAEEAKQQVAAASAAGVEMAALSEATLGTEGSLRPEVPLSLSRKDALSLARERAVQAVRGKILTDLNQLRSLVSTRDQLFRRYREHKRAVSFKPAVAISSKKRGLEEIGANIKSASSVYELSGLGREVAEIEAKIQDDIGLMKRMLKSG